MLQLFTEEYKLQHANIKMPETEYIRNFYLRELLNIQDYYHHRVYAVKSSHLVSQLTYHLSAPYDYEVERFVEVLRTRSPYVANAFGLTSDISPGVIHKGPFYGPQCPEILISNDGYFNPFVVASRWKSICAVKPLLHPRSDMKFLFANGRDVTTDQGLSVVSVNLPLLMLQYKCFAQQQLLKTEEEGRLGPSHFVHMYVLPNMLYASTDLAILNRASNLFYGAPMGETKFKHAFRIPDITDKLDKVLKKTLEQLQDSPVPYAMAFDSLPTVASDGMLKALRMPEIAPVAQIWWAGIVTRLPAIKFVIDLCGKRGVARNRGEIVSLQRHLKRLLRENILQTRLPEDIHYDTMLVVEEIMTL